MRTLALAALAFLSAAAASPQAADPAREVVIVVNEAAPGSLALGEYYAKKRGIPADRICRLTASTEETVSWPDCRKSILDPLRAFLAERPETLYVVPVWGVPVKTSEEKPENDGKSGAGDTIAQFVTGRDYVCIDREIELLRQEHEIDGWLQSATFGVDRAITVADRLYIVSRLDGPSLAAARAMVDNAIYGETYGVAGKCLLDTRGLKEGGYAATDEDMRKIAGSLRAAGLEFHHDDVEAVVPLGKEPCTGHYFGWYAGDWQGTAEFRFARGAVGAHLHSFSAGILRSPDRTWSGPLIAHGITGTCGTVYEPLASGFPYGAVFFDRFLRGYNFGQSMQMANMFTSWMAVFVGDPLYAPYSEAAKAVQAQNRDLARNLPGEVKMLIDAGDLDGAEKRAAELDRLPIALDGAGDLTFPRREIRARRLAKKPATGTVAELETAILETSLATDAKARIAAARKGLTLSEMNWECNLALGRALTADGNARLALEPLQRAAAVEPGDAGTQQSLAEAYVATAKLDEARAAYEAALAAGAGPDAARALGELLAKAGKHEEALVRLEPALAREPTDRGLALTLARSCLALKRPEPAAAALEKVVMLPPADPAAAEVYVECWETIAKAHKALGDKARLDADGPFVAGLGKRKKAGLPDSRAAAVVQALTRIEQEKKYEALPAPIPYDGAVAGLPTLWLCNRSEWDVEISLAGPLVQKSSFRGIKGATKLKAQELPTWPGKYRIAVTAKKGSETKLFYGEAVLEAGKEYSLAVDKDLRLYRAEKS